MKPCSVKVAVDRIEGPLAVLVLYDDDNVRFNFPVERLPGGLREGDHLIVRFEQDDESRKAETKKAEDLLNDLLKRDSSE